MPQQLLFELRDLDGDATVMTSMERLPKGEVVSVRFRPHQSLSLRLAKYDFVLVSGAPFLLIDDKGSDVKLNGRRVVIGRVPIVRCLSTDGSSPSLVSISLSNLTMTVPCISPTFLLWARTCRVALSSWTLRH